MSKKNKLVRVLSLADRESKIYRHYDVGKAFLSLARLGRKNKAAYHKRYKPNQSFAGEFISVHPEKYHCSNK